MAGKKRNQMTAQPASTFEACAFRKERVVYSGLPMPPAIIEARGVSKEYLRGGQRVLALSEVSLSVAPGDFVAILGPAGSGKSTFANLLDGMERPSGGTYRLDGEQVGLLDGAGVADVCSRKIGFVCGLSGLHGLPTRLTVERVVEQPLLRRCVPPEERRQQVQCVLAQLGVESCAQMRAGELGREQQQRVAIAQALVHRPAILLADEPTNALSSRESERILSILQALNSQGLTIVMATHDLHAARYAQRVVRLLQGRVESDQLNARL